MNIWCVRIGLIRLMCGIHVMQEEFFQGEKTPCNCPISRPGSLDPTYVMLGYNRLRSRDNAMGLCMSFVYVVRRSQNALLEVALSYSPK